MKRVVFIFILILPVLGFSQELDILDLSGQAEYHLQQEDYQQAVNIYQLAIDKVKSNYGTSHKYYGILLTDLAFVYQKMQDYNKALPLSVEALEIAKNVLGKAHPSYEIRLSNLATLYDKMKDYEKAEVLYIEALEVTEKYLGKGDSEYGYLLNDLAKLYEKIGEFDKAVLIHKKLLRFVESTLGKDNPSYGASLNNLAQLYENIGEHKKALPLYKEALENFKNTLGKEHSGYGNILNNLAGLYESMGEYQKALPLYLEALENTENSLGKEHPEYGIHLDNLANLYHIMGDYQKALPLYLKALENTENTLGKDHPDYGIRLSSLATLHQNMGEYNKALSLHLKALENLEGTLGKAHPDYGVSINNLAGLYESIGEYKKALPLYLKALNIVDGTLGKDHPNYIIFLNNLAFLHKKMGDYQKALPLYLEAVENAEDRLGSDHPVYGRSLNNLAVLYKSLGDYKKALPLLIQATKNAENTLGKTHPNYGKSLSNLAFLYKSMGDYQKALPLYLEALENTENALGKAHPEYGNKLNNLAGLYQSIEDNQKALPLLIKFNQIIQNQIKQNFSFLNEKGKESFIHNVVSMSLSEFSQFNYTTDNSYEKSVSLATNNILTSKGLLLNASKNILSQLESLKNDAINEKILQFRAQRAFINNQLQLSIDNRAQDFKAKKENLETLERELVKLYSANFGEDLNYVKNWQQTQLKDNELAIEFTHFRHYNKTWTDSTMYVAYLYKKDWETPKVVNLFEEKQLKTYLSSSNNPNIIYSTRGSKAKSTASQLAVADSIYNLVWQPLEEYVNTSDEIYYSPDGLLHKIAFAALPNPDQKRIGEVYDIHQMGSTADVGLNKTSPNLEDVLLIGGVKYDYKLDPTKDKNEHTYSILESETLLGSDTNRSISRNGFDYLKGTQEEITNINTLLTNAQQLSGYNATETAFKALSGKSPSVLHIATHGYFFPDLKTKTNPQNEFGQENTYKTNENPLLRSGLLFANANYAWQNGNNPYEDDDGILTALEISNLDLKNTNIVILSACETGLGDIEGSEGVYGLQRAFKMAGVNTIIMGLWEVPDAETAEFMNLFYTNWKSSNNHRKAFKIAQAEMMNKYKDYPQKWAAFVLVE